MKKSLKLFLFSNNQDILKKSSFWNMTASILNAMMSAFLLLVVTRIVGVVYGGIFSIASTVAYQTLTIGNYGMRNYQVTDVNYDFSFGEYKVSRYITCFIMIGFISFYAFFSKYNLEKSLIIFSFSFFKLIDALEDIYHGHYQQEGRLDVAAKAQTIRYFFSILFFVILLFITKDLLQTCFISTILSFIVFLFLNYIILDDFDNDNSLKVKNVFILLKKCFPLCLGAYLLLYICNSPKFQIDKSLSNQMQTYFGIIFMPVFTINLLSALIYRPMLNNLAKEWNSNDISLFITNVIKQIIIVLVLTFLILVGGYFLGITILEIIYGVSLDSYLPSLMILLIGGGFIALDQYFACLLTIFRKQNIILVIYFLVYVCSMFFSEYFVVRYQIFGASLLYTFLTLLLLVMFSTTVLICLRNKKNENLHNR